MSQQNPTDIQKQVLQMASFQKFMQTFASPLDKGQLATLIPGTNDEKTLEQVLNEYFVPMPFMPGQPTRFFATMANSKGAEALTVLEGQREKENPHVHTLMESFRKEYHFHFLFVNKHLKIVDGQHSEGALARLEEILIICIMPEWGVKQMHAKNLVQKPWQVTTLIKSVYDLGKNESYKLLWEFYQNPYPSRKEFKFPLSTTLRFIHPGSEKLSELKFNILQEEYTLSLGKRNNARELVVQYSKYADLHPKAKNSSSFVNAWFHVLDYHKDIGDKLFAQLQKGKIDLINTKPQKKDWYLNHFTLVYNKATSNKADHVNFTDSWEDHCAIRKLDPETGKPIS